MGDRSVSGGAEGTRRPGHRSTGSMLAGMSRVGPSIPCRSRSRRALLPLAFLCLLAAGCGEGTPGRAPAPGTTSPKPSPPSTDVVLPVGRPVQLDGRMPPAEWEDATRLMLGTNGSVLLLKQVRGMLLLGLDSPTPWPPGSNLWLMFVADEEGTGLYREGAIHLDIEPREHDRPHLLVLRREGPVDVPVEGKAVARASLDGTRSSIEVAIPLDLLGVSAETPEPVRFALLWSRPRSRAHVMWPPGLRTDAPEGGPPPDLASSERWGRLLDWKEASGPGAFPKTEWEAFLEEDREMARRGREAHAFGRRIGEETQTPKIDVEQGPVLIEGLSWIAEREPLTAADLLLLARGYRFLNRKAEALALLDALDQDPEWRRSDRLLYERARTLESAERYDEAARVWDVLARRARTPLRQRYEQTAAQARERLEGWSSEQAARREDEARSDLPLVLLRTNRGNIVLLLHEGDVPQAIEHFLSLVERREGERGFYDGTLFHRVIGDFLAQGGDPTSRDEGCDAAGRGNGPSTVPVETNPRHGFWRGAVGFARGPALENGCQFFLLSSPRPALGERDFTCFGHVVAGMDVVDRLEICDVLLEARVLRGAGTTTPDRGEEDAANAGGEEEE